MKTSKHHILKGIENLLVVFFLCFLYSEKAFPTSQDSSKFYKNLYQSAIKNDSTAFIDLEKCSQYFEHSKDTFDLVKTLIKISKLKKNEGNYNDVFFYLWKALHYSEQMNNADLLYETHNWLGILFEVFDKEKEALFHKDKAVFYAKKIYGPGLTENSAVVSAYYNLVHYYRKMEDYDRSFAYLDTCNMYADSLNYNYDKRIYLLSEKGNILRKLERYDEALVILHQSETNFKRLSPDYLPIIYFYLGSAYLSVERLKEAEIYFRKAVKTIEERKSHIDAKAECLSRLAICLEKQNRYPEAYKILRESKDFNDALFSSKSYDNAGLFSIRNMYREELKERDLIILEREKELVFEKAKRLRLTVVFTIIFAFIIIAALYIYIRFQRKKNIAEKERHQTKARLDKEKNRALVELKNKELTSFALRLIDKDSMVTDLMDTINTHSPDNEKLLKALKMKASGRAELWDEFDKRFLDVNTGFYEKLRQQCPELTPTELKHCALIKLNFSAKEMSQLLNISLNGVNTSRYRIRKKLNLERNENLVSFMNGV